MSTYTQILYQLVFSTYCRARVLSQDKDEELYKYIAGLLKAKRCHLYWINGVEDHIHILTHIHPAIALSDLIKDIKLASSDWIKQNAVFPGFNGWQTGYGAFTYSIREKDRLIGYVKRQKEHHRVKTFKEEYIELLEEHGVQYEEKYLL